MPSLFATRFARRSSFFGSNWNGQEDNVASLSPSSYGLWTVEQAAAASSMAPELFIALTTNKIADYLGFHADYFSPSSDEKEEKVRNYQLNIAAAKTAANAISNAINISFFATRFARRRAMSTCYSRTAATLRT